MSIPTRKFQIRAWSLSGQGKSVIVESEVTQELLDGVEFGVMERLFEKEAHTAFKHLNRMDVDDIEFTYEPIREFK